jgi:excisionase family DNA binding protein
MTKSTDVPTRDGVAIIPIAVRIPIAVAMLGIGRSKLYQFIKSGEIEVVKIGRSTLIPVDSLHEFLARQRAR